MRYILGLVALLFALPALAADQKTTEFVNTVAVANKYEIDTSHLALKYGKNAGVTGFAQQMVSDHEKAGADFKAALKEAGIEPPADRLDVMHTAKYAQLRVFTTESGFDAAYVDAQLKAHEDAVAAFKDYSANGTTPAVKSFAEKTLPTLEHHLAMVKELSETVKKPQT